MTTLVRPVAAAALLLSVVCGAARAQSEPTPPNNIQSESIDSLTKAAEAGNLEAAWKLAQAIDDQKPAEAAKWYKVAAEGGYAPAQFSLGNKYITGTGIKKDNAEGLRWLRRAAEQGTPYMQWALGGALSQGLYDVPKNPKEAAKWLRYAAEQGFSVAQSSLGLLYDTGEGVSQDFVLAYFWLNLAALPTEGRDLKPDEAVSLEKFNKLWRDLRDSVAGKMTASQIAEAQRLTREFKPKKWDALNKQPVNNGELEADVCGSGFFVTPDGYFVTNHHVVADARRVRIKTATGIHAVKVISEDRANDLAVLKAEGSFPALHISGSAGVRPADRVFTIGYPNPSMQGLMPKYSAGDVAALTGPGDDPRFLQISVPVQPGNSGGPLMDAKGGLVGVVVGQLDKASALKASGQLPENVNYAIKGSLLLTLLEAVPGLAANAAAVPPSSATDAALVKSVESATGMVLVDR